MSRSDYMKPSPVIAAKIEAAVAGKKVRELADALLHAIAQREACKKAIAGMMAVAVPPVSATVRAEWEELLVDFDFDILGTLTR